MISLQRILCPVDFSETSKRALDYATAIGAWYDAHVTALHVNVELPVFELAPTLGSASTTPVMLRDVDVDETCVALRRFVDPGSRPVPIDIVVQEAFDARAEILEQARTRRTDLLVMGTHGRSGFEQVLLGSVTEKVMRKAPCPVLVVPPHAIGPERSTSAVFKRIVCAIDFSDSSHAALDYALELAQEADAHITLVNAIEFPIAFREIAFTPDVDVDRLHASAEAEYLRRLRALVPPDARTYCKVTTRVSEGKPYREILRVAADEHADLIVMGVQGRGAMALTVFGSNTHGVLRGAECPVLVVPGRAKDGVR